MDIVSMALNSVQQNSELLGLATVAQQNNDAETSEGGIGALPAHSSVVTDVGLGLGSDTCTSTIIDRSAVSSSISGNCAPVILMMETDELRPSSDTSALTTTIENQHKPIFQNGESNSSKTAPLKVGENVCKETSGAENLKTTPESSTFMNSIPVELSSSTSAASSILGSIANMIDPNAANLTNTRIVSTNTVNRTNTRIIETNAITNNTLSNTHIINKTIANNTSVSIPLSSSQINTPTTMQQTVVKEPRLPITLPLQKSAATITIKTPPGTSLTGPSGSMSSPLLQTILNNAEVQALMKRNPGQQITIVQVPDESLGNGNWGIQSSIKSAVSEAKKIIPMNNTKVNYGSLPVGRKRKKVEEPEEKTKPSKVTRPVKKITRSGRISRPPLYRIRDYKTILPTEEVQSGSSEDDYEDYADQMDKDSSAISDKPKNFKCENCDKSYIGQASLDRHFRQNPTHGTPLGPSPEKKLTENMQSTQTDVADINTDKPDHQMSMKAADLNSSETSSSSRLQTSIMRGRGRGIRKRRGRGRLPFYANHTEKPAALWSNTETLPLDKRKQKVKELLNTFVDEDFLDVILPRLPNVLTPWELMLMKTESEESRKPNFVDIYNEYLSLVKEVKKVAQGCLTRISDDSKESSEDNDSSVMTLDIDNAAVADSLGLSMGSYKVKDSLMPLTRGLPSIPSKKTPPQMNEDVVDEEKSIETLSRPVEKTKVDEIQTENKQIQMPISKSMPSLTPLRNRPLNLKSVVTPGPIVEHPIPPGRPLPELKPITNSSDEATMVSTSLLVPVSQISLPTTVNSSPAILTDSLTSSPVLARLTETMPQEESSEMMEALSPEEGGVLAEDNTESPELPVTMPQEESNEMMETLSPGQGGGLAEDNTESPELPVTVQDQVQLLQSVDDDVSDLQLVPEVNQDVLPAVDETIPIDIMPVGSTLMQLQDGTFLVQRPDGTTMQIHAPEGMTIETIQELLTVDGAMHISDADTTDMPLESEDVAMVTGLDVNSADLSNEVAAT